MSFFGRSSRWLVGVGLTTVLFRGLYRTGVTRPLLATVFPWWTSHPSPGAPPRCMRRRESSASSYKKNKNPVDICTHKTSVHPCTRIPSVLLSSFPVISFWTYGLGSESRVCKDRKGCTRKGWFDRTLNTTKRKPFQIVHFTRTEAHVRHIE